MTFTRAITLTLVAGCLATAGLHPRALGQELPEVAFQEEPGKLRITVGQQPFATYVFQDAEITRPYFAHVQSPAGIQATRHHPPIEGQDPTDHADFHPGIWLAFADINGHDYWRLKARVKHQEFIQAPRSGPGQGTFAVRNVYLSTDGEERVCDEVCRYSIAVTPQGRFLIYESTFSSNEHDLLFGDQEEFGLGVRVNAKISVAHGDGHITNAEGLRDEAEVWGKASDWVDYSGVVDGVYLGMAIMPDPRNFRRSWFHARDYGLVAANPFGRAAMKAGPRSEVVVRKGASLRLGFAVFVYSNRDARPIDIGRAYQQYLDWVRAAPEP